MHLLSYDYIVSHLDKLTKNECYAIIRTNDRRLMDDMERDGCQLFQDLCNKYFEIENNPKKDKFYSIAWSLGHLSGFQEVFSIMQELIDLIK